MNGNIITVNYPSQHQHYVRKRKTDPLSTFKKSFEKKEPKTLAALPRFSVEEALLTDGEEKCAKETPSEVAFVQLANAQSAITFLKREHEVVLKGLHDQVEELQQKCRDLQFSLTLKLPYVPKEIQQHISELENLVEEKEIECIELRKDVLTRARKEDELRKELFFKEQAIIKLRKELAVRENVQEQLKRQLEATQEHQNGTSSPPPSGKCEKTKSLSSLFEMQKPIPPPKSSKDKTYSRPLSLYRRLLSLSSRSFSFDNTPPLLPPPGPLQPTTTPPEIGNRENAESSSIPHLPQLVSSTERPYIRQQIRINKLNNTDPKSQQQQPLVLNHLALPKYRSPRMPSEENHNGY